LEAISDDKCRDLLAVVQVRRVVQRISALPAASPVNYRPIDDAIVFRSTPGTVVSDPAVQRISGRRLSNPVTNSAPAKAQRP